MAWDGMGWDGLRHGLAASCTYCWVGGEKECGSKDKSQVVCVHLVLQTGSRGGGEEVEQVLQDDPVSRGEKQGHQLQAPRHKARGRQL